MKAPAFWWREPGLAAALLAPVAAVWGAVAARRMRRSGTRVPIPVLCVGNVTVGGSGKTPTAIALASLLRSRGFRPAFLTRGYGGSLAGPVEVDLRRHGAPEVGDEALLLARAAPTVVARDRPAGADLAAMLGADLVIMDDGLQNPSLEKTLSVAVFDGGVGIGNGRVLPAGPLRAPLSAQWPTIDAVLVIGPGPAGERIEEEARRRRVPVLRAELAPTPRAADRLEGRRVLAFAGIGRPEKFFATCRALGLDVVQTRSFPDHHPYGVAEIGALLDEAERQRLVPVTTEKDAVRLEPLRDREPRLGLVQTIPIEVAFAGSEALLTLLRARIGLPEGAE